MPDIKCFMLDETDRTKQFLRRYHSSRDKCSENPLGYHNAETSIGDSVVVHLADGMWRGSNEYVPHSDPRWPAFCICGYVFTPDDEWQVLSNRIYMRRDRDEEYTLGLGLVPGAMWYSDWNLPQDMGPDGHSLSIQTPGGEWCIDSSASNCTLPDDKVHKCWVRHGEVPNITVDKTGGPTCSAGAGSIQCGNYHGFLRNGYLVD